jgi:hypothetical protein
MSEMQTDCSDLNNQKRPKTSINPKGAGRKLGGKNKPGHHAGRPRKAAEEFPPSIWDHGKAEISVLDRHYDEALLRNSSHCAIAFAIRDAVPHARHISVDLQTIRYTDTKRGVRYCFLTPHVAQQDVIIPFDQGERDKCKEVTFRMRPAFVTRTGKKRTHAPDNDQLSDAKLKVAEEQPHVPSAAEEALAENWKPKSPGANGAIIAPPDNPELSRQPEPKQTRRPYKRREPRAKISETKLDGSVPVTLGGKLPPVSVLSRREFGLRVLARREFGLRQVKR